MRGTTAAAQRIGHNLGVRVTVDELRALRGRAGAVASAPGDAVAGLFPGAFRSCFFGRGLDFHEVRGYQPGDDFRTLDWRVTGEYTAGEWCAFVMQREE